MGHGVSNIERIPMISPDAGFPVGDISYESKRAVDAWIEQLEGMESFERRMRIGSAANRLRYSESNKAGTATQSVAEALCRKWDREHGDGMDGALTGFSIGQALINETGALPPYTRNLGAWLKDMFDNPDFDHQVYTHNALQSMQQSHPLVFDIYMELADKAKVWYSARGVEQQIVSGMVLPYMLSSVSIMLDEVRDTYFTAMTDQKLNLSEVELTQLFSTDKRASNGALIKEEAFVLRTKAAKLLGKALQYAENSDLLLPITQKPLAQKALRGLVKLKKNLTPDSL